MFQIHPMICGEFIKTHETHWRLNSSTRYVAVAAEQTAFVAESLQDQLQTIKHQETQIHRTSERPKEGDKTAGKLTPCKNRNHLGLFGCSGSKNLGNIRKLGNSEYSKSFRRCLTNHPKAWRSSVVAPGGASAVSMHTALDIENIRKQRTSMNCWKRFETKRTVLCFFLLSETIHLKKGQNG